MLVTAEPFTHNEYAVKLKKQRREGGGGKEGRNGGREEKKQFPNFISKHVSRNQQQNST